MGACASARYWAREAQALEEGWGEVPDLLSINAAGSTFDESRVGKFPIFRGLFGGPLETRTPDPLIKSQLLYQLS